MKVKLFIVLILVVAALAAWLLLFQQAPGGGTGDTDDTSPEACESSGGGAESRMAVAPSARIVTTKPADGISTSAEAPDLNECFVILTKTGPPGDDTEPGPPPGGGNARSPRGDRAIYTGMITSHGARIDRRDVTLQFVAGLNVGRTFIVKPGTVFVFENLYRGRNIVQYRVDGKVYLEKDVLLSSGVFDSVQLREPRSFSVPVVDETGRLVTATGAATWMDGVKRYSGGTAELDLMPGVDTAAYFYPDGFEYIKKMMLPPAASAGGLSPDRIIARRSGAVVVDVDHHPRGNGSLTAVLLPTNTRVPQEYPFESSGIKSVKFSEASSIASHTFVFEGVPLAESFDICVFSDIANSVPPLIHMGAVADANTPARNAKFYFEQRWPVRGRVLMNDNPVAGAVVQLEVENIAAATGSHFISNGGIDKIALPPLPPVRRKTVTNEQGKFTLESYEMTRPLTLSIQASSAERKVLTIDKQSPVNLNNIELVPAATHAGIFFRTNSNARVRAFVQSFDASVAGEAERGSGAAPRADGNPNAGSKAKKTRDSLSDAERDAFRKSAKVVEIPPQERSEPLTVDPGAYSIMVYDSRGHGLHMTAHVRSEYEVLVLVD